MPLAPLPAATQGYVTSPSPNPFPPSRHRGSQTPCNQCLPSQPAGQLASKSSNQPRSQLSASPVTQLSIQPANQSPWNPLSVLKPTQPVMIFVVQSSSQPPYHRFPAQTFTKANHQTICLHHTQPSFQTTSHYPNHLSDSHRITESPNHPSTLPVTNQTSIPILTCLVT